MNTFTYSRLTLARKRRGLTISELAKRVDLTTRRISSFEHGAAVPPETTLVALAGALDFPREFFFGPELHMPSLESASFRALTNMTAGQRDAALGAGTIAITLSEWIDVEFHLPSPELADLREVDPETAAGEIRAQWGLGEQPIRNLIHLLEGHGVRVFSLSQACAEVDAFSLWRDSVPFVFLNTMKSSERSRFDTAHELGHLVLHRHGGPQGREAEAEADRFASAFLMPAGSVLAQAPRFPTVNTLVKLKKVWNVSVAALTHRLRTLNLLSEWHYRQLFIEISERGFRKREPLSSPRETSQVLTKVFNALREDGISKADVARKLSIFSSELEALVFGLVMLKLEGGVQVSDGMRPVATRRPDLRLVWNPPTEDEEHMPSPESAESPVTDSRPRSKLTPMG